MALTTIPGDVDTSLTVTTQTSLFGSAPFRCRPIDHQFDSLDRTSAILFVPQWLEGSNALFEQLRIEMNWRATRRPMYDRILDVPRLICTQDVNALTCAHPLAIIATALSDSLGASFTEVGLNYYRNGKDSVAWHRDRVGHHRHASTVALVSLGAPRTFQIRRFRGSGHGPAITSKTPETPVETWATRRRWQLGQGDLFVMTGAAQRDWEHAVPKQTHVGARISLAFRCQEALGGSPFVVRRGATIKG